MLAEQARIPLAHAAPGRDREGGHRPGLDQASFGGSAGLELPAGWELEAPVTVGQP